MLIYGAIAPLLQTARPTFNVIYLLQPGAGRLVDHVFIFALGRVGLVELEHVEVLGVRELHLLHGVVECGRSLLQGRPYDLEILK